MNMSKGKERKTGQVLKIDYILLFVFSIAERKDVGKSKSLRKTTSTVEEKLSNAGSLFIFKKRRSTVEIAAILREK